MKIYVIDWAEVPDEYYQQNKEDMFQKEAERQGRVYELWEFEEGFNENSFINQENQSIIIR